MLNIEGKENFIIQNSLFDIRYSKQIRMTKNKKIRNSHITNRGNKFVLIVSKI